MPEDGAPRTSRGVLTMGREIGRGTFGTVFEGMYDGRPVVVKQLLKVTENTLQEFLREMELWKRFSKRGLFPKLHGVCLDRGVPLIVMERLECSLTEYLQQHGSPWMKGDKLRALSLMLGIAQATAFLHEHNVIHWDLTSRNILMDSEGRPKISDFGLAKVKTASGVFSAAGSVHWMAPEAFGGSYTLAMDVYSLAVVFWEVLTGEVPWVSAANTMAVMRKVDQGERPVLPTDVDAPLRSLIEAMWATEPSKRPSMREIVTALQEMSSSLGMVEQQWMPTPPQPVTNCGGSCSVSPLSLVHEVTGPCTFAESNVRPQSENLPSALQAIGSQQAAWKHTNDMLSHLLCHGMNGKLDASAAVALFRALPSSDITLLDLSKYFIGTDGARTLAHVLPQTRITALNLRFNGIFDRGAAAIAAVLAQTCLTTLDLYGNNIGDGGTEALAAVLPLTQITALDLRGNHITGNGAAALARVLPLTRIATLNLGWNSLGDRGVAALADVLPQSLIMALDLRGNYISDEARKALTAAFNQRE